MDCKTVIAACPLTLQFGNHGKQPRGAIRWRKVQVRER